MDKTFHVEFELTVPQERGVTPVAEALVEIGKRLAELPQYMKYSSLTVSKKGEGK